MSRARIYVPGRGTIQGPDCPTADNARSWARGYMVPTGSVPLTDWPKGTTVTIDGAVSVPDSKRRRLRPLGA